MLPSQRVVDWTRLEFDVNVYNRHYAMLPTAFVKAQSDVQR